MSAVIVTEGKPMNIRKIVHKDDPTPTQRESWDPLRALARKAAADGALTFDQAVLQTVAERRHLAAGCAGTWDYTTTTAPPPDAGALTPAKIAEQEINALAVEEQERDPSLTDAAAVAKALDTPAGRAAYSRLRAPDAHLTALQLAAITEHRIAGFSRLLKAWRAPTCGAFVHDRALEVAPDNPTGVGCAIVSKVFPREWDAARAGL